MPKIFNVINRERLCAAFLLFNFGYFASQAVKTFNDPTPPPPYVRLLLIRSGR